MLPILSAVGKWYNYCTQRIRTEEKEIPVVQKEEKNEASSIEIETGRDKKVYTKRGREFLFYEGFGL